MKVGIIIFRYRKKGAENERRKEDWSKVYQSFALVTQFGITMLVPIALCSFLGWYLDQRLGTEFLFVLLFFVGALAGFRNIFILARKVYENKDTPNNDYASVRSRLAKEKGQTDHVLISKKGDGRNAQASRHQ